MEEFDYTECPTDCTALELFGDVWMCGMGISSPANFDCIMNKIIKSDN